MDDPSVRAVPKAITPESSVRKGGSMRPPLSAISSFSAAMAMERNFPNLNKEGTGHSSTDSVHGVASHPWPTLPAPATGSAGNIGGAAAWKAGLEGSFHSISEVEVAGIDSAAPTDPWWAGPPLAGRAGSATQLSTVVGCVFDRIVLLLVSRPRSYP